MAESGLTEQKVLALVIKRFASGGRAQGGGLITHSATEPCCLHAAVRYATGWRYPHTRKQDPLVALGRSTMARVSRVLRKHGITKGPIRWNDEEPSTPRVLTILREAKRPDQHSGGSND